MPLFNLFLSSKSKTKRLVRGKKITKGTLRHSLKKLLKDSLYRSLKEGNDISIAVKLPSGENLNEWLAVNVTEIYNTVLWLESMIAEECTNESCPTMSAGVSVNYFWADGKQIKKPLPVTAREYMTYLLQWVSSQIDDEKVFPINGEFPKDFLVQVKQITKKLLRPFAHIWHHHWQSVKNNCAEMEFLLCFAHYFYFVSEFKLIDIQHEMQPMQELLPHFMNPLTSNPEQPKSFDLKDILKFK